MIWRFRDGQWESAPMDLTFLLVGNQVVLDQTRSGRTALLRAGLDSTEDVELYATELGITRAQAHGRFW